MDVVLGGVAEGQPFAEGLALDKELLLPCACLCRGLFFVEGQALSKDYLPSARAFPSVNPPALGKDALSGSDTSIKNITSEYRQWKDNFDLRVKTPILQGQLTG